MSKNHDKRFWRFPELLRCQRIAKIQTAPKVRRYMSSRSSMTRGLYPAISIFLVLWPPLYHSGWHGVNSIRSYFEFPFGHILRFNSVIFRTPGQPRSYSDKEREIPIATGGGIGEDDSAAHHHVTVLGHGQAAVGHPHVRHHAALAFQAETDSLNGLAGCDTVTVFDSPGRSENQLSE